MSQDPGFIFFSAGSCWQNAFAEAGRVMGTREALVLGGPRLGPSGERWLSENAKSSIIFGKTFFRWNEWVRERARIVLLTRSEGFRILSGPAERELFRETLRTLQVAGQLPLLSPLLEDEKFFSSLHRTVQELRLAGIKRRESIERAMELLGKCREKAYGELWALLAAFAARLASEEIRALDRSDLFEIAAEGPAPGSPLYFLGFSEASQLEVDLLQSLARQAKVFLPLDAPLDKIRDAVGAKGDQKLSSSLRLAKALATNFSGAISFLEKSESQSPRGLPYLEAHTPEEELRAASALTRLLLEQEKSVSLVLPREMLSSIHAEDEFCSALGIERKIQERSVSERRLGMLLWNAVSLREKNYALGPALEYADLLRVTRGEEQWRSLPLRAARFGIREGLIDWRRRAGGDPFLGKFVEELEALGKAFPERGMAADFHGALLRLAEILGFAQLTKGNAILGEEREAHGILAAFLRGSAKLAASLRSEYSYSEWLREFRLVLLESRLANSWEFPDSLRIYEFGEWIAPVQQELIFLGMNEEIEPLSRGEFYLEDAARRLLDDFLLPLSLQEELELVHYLSTASGHEGNTLLSRSRFTSGGTEQKASWLLETLRLEPRHWPIVPPPASLEKKLPELSPRVRDSTPETFSASLLNDYKTCGFLAFARRILRLEDQVHSPWLDIERTEEGSLAHVALEIFYREKNGRELGSPAERERLLQEAFSEARAALKARYYMGNESLLSLQLLRLQETLQKYVEAEAEFFARNPELKVLECEWEFLHVIEGRKFKGVVDRIDVDRAQGIFMVVDYKIGATPSSKEVREFSDFQLFVYLDAAENFVHLEPAAAYYGSLRDLRRNQGLIISRFNQTAKKAKAEGGKKYFEFSASTGALVSDEEFSAMRAEARKEMNRLLTGLENGNFPVLPLDEDTCSSCSVRPACRIRDTEEFSAFLPFPKEELLELLAQVNLPEKEGARVPLEFHGRQEEALRKVGSLVFLEASAGTGKTTVLVEKVRRFLKSAVEEKGIDPVRAVEGFTAITFSEKSAAELSLRLSALLLEEYGVEVAASARDRVSTIHGFCRKIIHDFPLEAEANPVAGVVEERGASEMMAQSLEELFLADEVRENLSVLTVEYSRREVQGMLEQLARSRSLVEKRAEELLAVFSGTQPIPENFLLAEPERQPFLRALLEIFQEFCRRYDAKKWKKAALDFNDLERLAEKAVEKPAVRAHYQEAIDLLLVDEFQDTNSTQRKILEAIARPGWSNVFVVGDAKQSIYRFRDADVSVFQSLRKIAANQGSLYELDTNFRSQANIVRFASLVSKAIFPDPASDFPEFEASWAEVEAKKEPDETVKILAYSLEGSDAGAARMEEARLVAELVAQLLQKGKKPEDISILLRKISGNQEFLHSLTRAGIPFRLGSSSAFYQQVVVLDGLALLRALGADGNDLALFAVLRSPWIALSDETIAAIQARNGPTLWAKLREEEAPLLFSWKEKIFRKGPSALLREAYLLHPDYSGRRSRLQIHKFLSIVEELEQEGLGGFELGELLSQWAGWEKESDAAKEKSVAEDSGGAVQVMTIHAAKGLEFDTVILPDLESGTAPDNAPLRFYPGLGASLRTEADDDKKRPSSFRELGELNREREKAESKRLFYVALTRAKREQYLLLRTGEKHKAWAAWIKDLARDECYERIEAGAFLRKEAVVPREITVSRPTASKSAIPALPMNLSDLSISEIAATKFCPEFHRLKFVQAWDDLVVNLWPVPAEWLEKVRRGRKRVWTESADQKAAARCLKKLELERKERGTALHRVLERVRDLETGMKEARHWLEEAYVAQGAPPAALALQELLDLDMDVLSRFLSSPIGQELFAPTVAAFPELSFSWKYAGTRVHGTIDRAIRYSENHWAVVDYKSSLLEESLERYEFQVSAYAAAVAASLREQGISDPKVDSYLVNLFTAEAVLVDVTLSEAENLLADGINKVRGNYEITEACRAPSQRGVRGGELCFSCPYSLHCDVGREFVLS